MHVNVFDFSELLARSPRRYSEFLRVSSLSVGIYVLERGERDPQKPHTEDEVYYIASGRAKMRMEADREVETFDVRPGSIIFVPARMRHAFYDITERLAILVFFGPAQHSDAAGVAITSKGREG